MASDTAATDTESSHEGDHHLTVGSGCSSNNNNNSNSNNNRANSALPETYRLEVDEIVQAPRPFDIPIQPYYRHHWTGRVTCVARREGGEGEAITSYEGSCPNEGVVFYVQGMPGIYRTRALFVAQQRLGVRGSKGPRYEIYNIYNDNAEKGKQFTAGCQDPRYAGHLETRKQSYRGYVHCSLFRADGKEVSSTIYERKSLGYHVTNGSADRVAYSVIRLKKPICDSRNSTGSSSSSSSSSLHQVIQENIHQDIHNLRTQYNDVQVFQSKRRFTDHRGKAAHDDAHPFYQRFGRRAQLPSKKNIQLMDVDTGRIMIQVGRWDANEFTCDFLPPYTPYDAFGFALAQMECNR